MHLLCLPTEILEQIGSELRWSDLVQLNRVCSALYRATRNLALQDAYLCTRDGWHVDTKRQPLSALGPRMPGIRSLTVASPDPEFTVEATRLGRCLSCEAQANEGSRKSALGGEEDSVTLAEQLGTFRRGKLQSFTWALGVCAPSYIYNQFAKDQPNIRELNLITAYRRYGVRCTWRIPNLTQFHNITRFSWTGFNQNQLPILDAAFRTFAHQLEHLHLDLLAISTGVYTVHFGDVAPEELEADEAPNADSMFERLITDMAKDPRYGGENGVVFPALRSLSLTNTALGPRSQELCRAFNGARLEVLRLKSCHMVSRFLLALERELVQRDAEGEEEEEEAEEQDDVDAGSSAAEPTNENNSQPPKKRRLRLQLGLRRRAAPLRVLELHLTHAWAEDRHVELYGLMGLCKRLEEFVDHVVTQPARVAGGYGLAAAGDLSRTEGRHLMGLRRGETPRLRRFVFHPGWRWEAPGEEGAASAQQQPPPPGPELGPSERAYQAEPMANPLSHLRLEFLGYAASPLYMKMYLESCVAPEALSNLVVLHVRQYYEKKPRFYSHAFGAIPMVSTSASHSRRSSGIDHKDDDTTNGHDSSNHDANNEERPMRTRLTRECYELASWVFGNPDRFPKLKILAFGDFGAIQPINRLLLCRAENPVSDPPLSPSALAGTPLAAVEQRRMMAYGIGDTAKAKAKAAAAALDYYELAERSWRVVRGGDQGAVSVLDEYMSSLTVGPDYSRPLLRESGATLTSNVWRPKLGTFFARESEAMAMKR